MVNVPYLRETKSVRDDQKLKLKIKRLLNNCVSSFKKKIADSIILFKIWLKMAIFNFVLGYLEILTYRNIIRNKIHTFSFFAYPHIRKKLKQLSNIWFMKLQRGKSDSAALILYFIFSSKQSRNCYRLYFSGDLEGNATQWLTNSW